MENIREKWLQILKRDYPSQKNKNQFNEEIRNLLELKTNNIKKVYQVSDVLNN